MSKLFRILSRIALIAGAVYAALFAVFYFDLDGKLLFYVVEPFLNKHYEKMPRRDMTKTEYKMGAKF